MRGRLQRFQGIDVQMIADLSGEYRAYTGDLFEQCDGVVLSAQGFQAAHPARRDEFVDRPGDAFPDAGQRRQAGDALAFDQVLDGVSHRFDRVGRAAVGTDPKWIRILGGEQIGDLAQ